jgi:hypothetical protein
MLTYDIICSFRSAIVEESQKVVTFLRNNNRAIYKPEFDGIYIQPYPRNTSGIIAAVQFSLIERLAFGSVTLNFAYTVDQDGHVWPVGNGRLAHTYMCGIQKGVDYASTIVGRPAQARAFTTAIKEELVAKVWAPARMAKLLERGGWDLVEAV